MKQKFSSENLKWMIVIFGIIIAFIEILNIIMPLVVSQFGEMSLLAGVLFLLFLGALGCLGLFVLIFLGFGWQHPKWYVKSYAVVCLFWEFLCAISWFVGPWLLGWFYGEDAILAVPPLIPIWYWCYKEYRKEEEQKKI